MKCKGHFKEQNLFSWWILFWSNKHTRKEYYFWIKVNAASITGEYWKYKNTHSGLPRLTPNQVWYMTYPSFACTCREGVQPRTVWVWLYCCSIPPTPPCGIASGGRKGEHTLEPAPFYSIFFQGKVARTSPADSIILPLPFTSLRKNTALSDKHSWAQGSTGVSVQETDTREQRELEISPSLAELKPSGEEERQILATTAKPSGPVPGGAAQTNWLLGGLFIIIFLRLREEEHNPWKA